MRNYPAGQETEKFSGVSENTAGRVALICDTPRQIVSAPPAAVRRPINNMLSGREICEGAGGDKVAMAATFNVMSYKTMACICDVTEFDGLSDIIGPSNKKIKVVFYRMSIYALGLTN